MKEGDEVKADTGLQLRLSAGRDVSIFMPSVAGM